MTWRGLTGRQQRALDLLAELADEHGQAGPDGEPTVTLARWRGGLVTRDVLGVTRRDMRIAVSVSVSVSVLNSLPIFHFRNARHFGSRGSPGYPGAPGRGHKPCSGVTTPWSARSSTTVTSASRSPSSTSPSPRRATSTPR